MAETFDRGRFGIQKDYDSWIFGNQLLMHPGHHVALIIHLPSRLSLDIGHPYVYVEIIKSLVFHKVYDWCRRIFLVARRDRPVMILIHEADQPFIFWRRVRISFNQKANSENLSSWYLALPIQPAYTPIFVHTETWQGKKWYCSLCGLQWWMIDD